MDDLERRRLKLSRDLAAHPPKPGAKRLRTMTAVDYPAVAAVLHDAYRGTVHDEGEEPADSLAEVIGTMSGRYGPPIPSACLVGLDDGGRTVAAVMTTVFEGEPLIAHAVTDPACRRRGWATGLIEQALQAVADTGYAKANLVVIQGNLAQSLYERLGFRRI